jgi:predicted transcriptional regulator
MANTGQIVKSKLTEKYTSISNDILRFYKLSMEERGMISYLLSLPSDWVLYRENLYNSMNDGKTTIDRVFRQLQKKGFIVSIRVHEQATGKFIGWNHVVYAEPVIPIEKYSDIGNNRDRENPISVNTDLGKSTPIQKKDINTKEIFNTKEKINTKEQEDLVFISDDWKGLWNEWIEYKDIQFKQKYKLNKYEQIAINKLVKLSKGNLEEAQQIVCQSMEATWQSFYPLKNNNNVTTKSGNKPSNYDLYEQRRQELHKWAAEIDKQRGFGQ